MKRRFFDCDWFWVIITFLVFAIMIVGNIYMHEYVWDK